MGRLVEQLLKGEPLALARAITVVENDLEGASAILTAIQPHLGRARIIGVTGPPGVGKSTLIDAMIAELRSRGKTVGLLAVDPSSSLTGGAILGDRIRMASHTNDQGVFIRSLASRGHLGGLFRTALGVVQVMDSAGPDFVIIETVGAGQSDMEIASVAQTRIVVCAPGLGDDIQAIKAGILEIADFLVVNKCDMDLAAETVRQLQSMLKLRDPALGVATVLATTATTGLGIAALADALEAAWHPGMARTPDPGRRIRQIFADTAADVLRRHLQTSPDPSIEILCERVKRGELGFEGAARLLLKDLVDNRDLVEPLPFGPSTRDPKNRA